jgi:DNA polymerase-3 subunit epsilon
MFFLPSPAWDEVTYWSLDLETGGLDPKKDPIISVGMVPVRGGLLRLSESYRTLVRLEADEAISADSMRAHQLLPGEMKDAPPLGEVMAEVDRRIAGGVLLVHQAAIDVRFLKRAHERVRRRWPGPAVVDTVDLLVKAAKKARFIDPSANEREPTLNLSAARERLGLPEYGAHDALVDAIATAELFLVLRRQLGARTLRQLT